MAMALADDVVMIALHGVALSTAEVEQVVAPLRERFRLEQVRWVFPRAPWRRITLLGGRPALAWYDLLSWDRSRTDEIGLEHATRSLIEKIAAQSASGVAPARAVLAGFSQGGALALHAGLRLGRSLAGVVAVSSALPSLRDVPRSSPESPPFFLAHGWFDSVVPFSMGRHTMRALVRQGYRVDWHSYPIGHWISERCLTQLADWIERHVLRAEPARAPAVDARPAGARRRPGARGRKWIIEELTTLADARLAASDASERR